MNFKSRATFVSKEVAIFDGIAIENGVAIGDVNIFIWKEDNKAGYNCNFAPTILSCYYDTELISEAFYQNCLERLKNYWNIII